MPVLSKESRERHRQQIRDGNVRLRERRREYIRTVKATTPCKDCGKMYPYWVMDFDHLGGKTERVSRLIVYGWETLKKEIAKCEVVCSNCHRERTQRRMKSPDEE